MGSDCTVKIDNGYLNVRVGAIIRRNEQILMVTSDRCDYYYSVGGRIQFGETAEEAVIREVLEETGTRMEIDRLGFIHENYFYDDIQQHGRQQVYEIAFYFYMKVPDNFDPFSSSSSRDLQKETLSWVTPWETKAKLFPAFFRTELKKEPSGEIKHIVTDDRSW